MGTKKILTVLVFVLASVLVSNAHGKITLTVNNQDINSITLEVGQSCTVEVVSSDSTPYEAYIGFYGALVIGDFSPLEIKPEAGKGAELLKYSTPGFRGYHVKTGIGFPPPSPGVHFVFQFEAQEVGETDIKLFDENLKFELDSLHITVIPTAMGTGFTYQGRLLHDNTSADGPYDFEFKLYDSPAGGNQLASTIDINDLDVIDGYFTVQLDFNEPNVFNGDARWLDVAVRPGNSADPFTTLSPRQELTPTPYALHTSGVFVGNRNTFVGREAGSSNCTGGYNTFLGVSAGRYNTEGRFNTFLGSRAGHYNTTGITNTFVGYQAGFSNTTGYTNTFVGHRAGHYNTEGEYNTFLGSSAGQDNTTGYTNTFVGDQAGSNNTTGYTNTFVGHRAGFYNTTGYTNTFVGYKAGFSNTMGTGNVFIGYEAGENELRSNKLYIANSYAHPPLIYGDFSSGNVGIGTTDPAAGLHLKGSGFPDSFMCLESDSGQDAGIRLHEGGTVKWHLFNEADAGGLSLRNNAYSSVLFTEYSGFGYFLTIRSTARGCAHR